MAEPGFESTLHLVRAAQGGDRAALDGLVERYLPLVRQVTALRMGWRLRQVMDLEDVVQSALLRTLQDLRTFEQRSEGSFRNWLARCVEHEIIRIARSESRQKRGAGRVVRFADLESRLLHTSILAGASPTPSEVVSARETEERIETALIELPEHYREVIILRHLCGMSYAEVAQLLGFAEEASARMAASRALAKLKAALERGEAR